MPIGDWSSHVCSSDLTVRPSPAWPARRSASSAPRRPRSSASWSRCRRWSSAIPAPRATAPPPSSDRRSACSQRRNVGGVLALPHIHSGKVRDIYAIGDDRLLMVASDRLSAFDVVLDEPITDKGRVLTAMSAFWFAALGDVIGNHLISTDVADLPEEARSSRSEEHTSELQSLMRISSAFFFLKKKKK